MVEELMGAKVEAAADEVRAPDELERVMALVAIADVGSPAAERRGTLTLDWIDMALRSDTKFEKDFAVSTPSRGFPLYSFRRSTGYDQVSHARPQIDRFAYKPVQIQYKSYTYKLPTLNTSPQSKLSCTRLRLARNL